MKKNTIDKITGREQKFNIERESKILRDFRIIFIIVKIHTYSNFMDKVLFVSFQKSLIRA